MKSSESNIETIVCSQSEHKTQIDFNEPHNEMRRNGIVKCPAQFESQARINANFIQIKLKWIIQLNERKKGKQNLMCTVEGKWFVLRVCIAGVAFIGLIVGSLHKCYFI